MSSELELFMEVRIPSDITEYKSLKDTADDFNIVGDKFIYKLFCYNGLTQNELELTIHKMIDLYEDKKELNVIQRKAVSVKNILHRIRMRLVSRINFLKSRTLFVLQSKTRKFFMSIYVA